MSAYMLFEILRTFNWGSFFLFFTLTKKKGMFCYIINLTFGKACLLTTIFVKLLNLFTNITNPYYLKEGVQGMFLHFDLL